LYFSAGERGAEFVNPQDITRDNGKFTASMRMEEFLQTILFVGKTGAKEAIYSYGHRNPQG
jgi:glucose/arabinose dehydrogenase